MDCSKVTVCGRLGADAELGTAKSGKRYARIRVAASVKRGENENTNWFSVTLWDKLAENVGPNLKKGDRVLVLGTLELETYTSQKDGVERQSLAITWVDQFLMLSPRPQGQQAQDRGAPAGWPEQGPGDFNPPQQGQQRQGFGNRPRQGFGR